MSDFKAGDKIRIKSCASQFWWYSRLVGQVYTLRSKSSYGWSLEEVSCADEDYYIFSENDLELVKEKPIVLEEHPLESYPNKGYELKGSPAKDALAVQVGGGHYKGFKIQPVEYIYANNIPFLEGNVIKYTSRHRDKNRAVDIKKAIHCLELILKLEYPDEV